MADTRKREYLRRVRNKHSVARGLASGFLKRWDRDYFLNSVREAKFLTPPYRDNFFATLDMEATRAVGMPVGKVETLDV